jgi:hypothetical protein
LHSGAETPEQSARRRDALTATRTVNNMQVGRPEARSQSFLNQAGLASVPPDARAGASRNELVKRLSFSPGTELLPGWKLTLDVTPQGYWFMVADTTDPCGFAYISNQSGLIFTAEPLR